MSKLLDNKPKMKIQCKKYKQIIRNGPKNYLALWILIKRLRNGTNKVLYEAGQNFDLLGIYNHHWEEAATLAQEDNNP